MRKYVGYRVLLTIVAAMAQPGIATAQDTCHSSAHQPKPAGSVNKATVRSGLTSSIPPFLYENWKKYGKWDYKQRGYQYRGLTQFNFDAVGSQFKIDRGSLMALAREFRPGPDDINSLDSPELETNFARNVDIFDKLRKMGEQDARVIRIAEDYTWLDGNDQWPRDDIGFSEARWDDYRSLFKELALPEGIVRTEDFQGAIFFIAYVEGLCTGGSSAGYVYSTKALVPTTQSPKDALDAEAHKNADRHYAYVFKPLKENWYTFYQVDW
jgi:hypothetical protein